jgi:2-iminobutanoate/2-iminopropanoate deaminase
MEKMEIQHPDRPKPLGAYSAGVRIDGWLFVSGQGPVDLKAGKVVPGSIEEQTRLTLLNIDKILHAADCTLADIVKCGCYIADIKDFDRFNQAYADFFSGVLPARTTVQAVLWGGIKVEIDAIARLKPETKPPR